MRIDLDGHCIVRPISKLLNAAWWGRVPALGPALGRAVPPALPAVLVLSMPRSGSSWAGEVLGLADNALYLREPVTWSWHNRARRKQTVFEVTAGNVPPDYSQAARLAFAGVPYFPNSVVGRPQRWGLSARARRRVVIKEVNPLAAPYYCGTFRPRTILLLRHPAAIILSFMKLGWYQAGSLDDWRILGGRIGSVFAAASESLEDHGDYRAACYEDLCRDPTGAFRKLFEFAELDWSKEVEAEVAKRSSGGSRAEIYGTTRESALMAEAWRKHIAPEQVAAVREGYAQRCQRWYDSDGDWSD